ncbi:hypothetical protein GMRT_12062 [Giardia muris]|uniref:Uncharacterized protein n=1 Tax=Giardia muris TaxID=5742 RepID=A0A4Z1SPH4_GIAMU|nr:hypothetical protein GMRT_12062 [Giardia muris]|eukprot:TNJ27696.1 hypothetical protein GMRT_12062 [Giardia muris]
MSFEPGGHKTLVPQNEEQRDYAAQVSAISAAANRCLFDLAELKGRADAGPQNLFVEERILEALQASAGQLQRTLQCTAAIDHTTYLMQKLLDMRPVLGSLGRERLSEARARAFLACARSFTHFYQLSHGYLCDLFDIK